jgi:hypothetical protein
VGPAIVDEIPKNRKGIKQPPHLITQVASIRNRVSTEKEILLDCQSAKNHAPFGNVDDAALDDFVRGQTRDYFVQKAHLAGARFLDPANRPQGGALARPIGADQRDDLPFVHVQGKSLNGYEFPVTHLDVPNLKHGPSLQDLNRLREHEDV